MTDGNVTLYADGVGVIEFDGYAAVASSLDAGYPEKNGASGAAGGKADGAGKLVLEGYFLDRELLASGGASGETGGSGKPSRAARLKALLSAIAAPGREFFIAVGERKRSLTATALAFSNEAPFSSGAAEKFRLTASSADPYFRGGEIAFAGAPSTRGGFYFPAHGPIMTAEMRRIGEVAVYNDGDETCGFIFEASFAEATPEFTIESDRESGRVRLGERLSAGDTLVIDTRRGHKFVGLSDGTNLISDVNENCAFFSAPPGRTVLRWTSYSDVPPVVSVRLTPGHINP